MLISSGCVLVTHSRNFINRLSRGPFDRTTSSLDTKRPKVRFVTRRRGRRHRKIRSSASVSSSEFTLRLSWDSSLLSLSRRELSDTACSKARWRDHDRPRSYVYRSSSGKMPRYVREATRSSPYGWLTPNCQQELTPPVIRNNFPINRLVGRD